MSPRTRRLLVAGGVATILAGSVVGWYLLVRAPDDRRAARLSAELDRDIAAFRDHWQRVERPVLRGEPLAGNAAEAARAAVARLPATPEIPGDIAERVAEGDVPEAIVELARAHDAELRALRDTARWRHAWTDIEVERGGAHTVFPSYVPLLRAGRLLAVQAHLAAPGECLRIGADTIRVAQDLAPGVGILGVTVAAAIIHEVAPIVASCLALATPAERAAAAQELAVLATHAPPLGGALELEALLAGATFRITAEVGWIPTSMDELETMRHRGIVLDAWERVAHDPASWRGMTPDRYPEAAATWEREQAARLASGNPLVALGGPDAIARFIEGDMEVQALLRALAIAARVDEAGEQTPPEVATSLLRDPFTGDAFLWRVLDDGAACVYSVGPDLVDDGCGAGSDDVRALVGPVPDLRAPP